MTTELKRNAHKVPVLDTVLPFNPTVVTRPINSNDVPGTPMCKIRYNQEADIWEAVSVESRGMFVFLNDEPEPDHNRLRVTSIAGTGKGCHADSFKA